MYLSEAFFYSFGRLYVYILCETICVFSSYAFSEFSVTYLVTKIINGPKKNFFFKGKTEEKISKLLWLIYMYLSAGPGRAVTSSADAQGYMLNRFLNTIIIFISLIKWIRNIMITKQDSYIGGRGQRIEGVLQGGDGDHRYHSFSGELRDKVFEGINFRLRTVFSNKFCWRSLSRHEQKWHKLTCITLLFAYID